MNEEPFDSDYTAPQVTEEYLDSGGNYVDASSDEGNLGILGSPGDPQEGKSF